MSTHISAITLPRSFPFSGDRHFISDGSCDLKSQLNRMGVAAKAAHQDLALEVERTLPINSYKNGRCTSNTVDDTVEFQKYYRPPNYLILDEKDIGWGFLGLFDCLCIKFCYDRDIAKPKLVKPGDSIKSTIDNIRKRLKSIDILVIPYDTNNNFEKIIIEIRKSNQDLPILIMQHSLDKANDMKTVISLRSQGFHAFAGTEALYMQEFTTKLITHALGKSGIDRLKINPMYVNP